MCELSATAPSNLAIGRSNAHAEPRLTATDRSDSEGREQSSVGLHRVVRCTTTSKLILADIKCAMKHAEDVDVATIFHQIGVAIVSVQQHTYMPGRGRMSRAHFRKVGQSLRLIVDSLHSSCRSTRIFNSNVSVNIAQPALGFRGPNYSCHCLILRPISWLETMRPASESASPR